jgi:ligand-binding SRPBCC domain-containing protein
MPVHTLHRKLQLPTTREKAWAFFSDPGNLSKITPPAMGLQVLTTDLPPKIHAGMMIAYRITPLAGIPMTWLTEITHLREGEYFVDEQRTGPYALWHHEHIFRDAPGGAVEMEDRITYMLPFKWLGELVLGWKVRSDLKRIFDHREKVVREVFGMEASPP